MTTAESALRLVEELPVSMVESLIQQLRAGLGPSMPNPNYQARADQFVRLATNFAELALMLEVALAAKRVQQTTELVRTGPATSVVPVRSTEQVLSDLIDYTRRKLTIMSFGIFQLPRLVENLEQALERHVDIRIILGDREPETDWVLDRQRYQLGQTVA